MTNRSYKEKMNKLKAEICTIIEKDPDPQALKPLVNEIATLLEPANSVGDLAVLLETLQLATSFVDVNCNQNKQYWKKDLTTLAHGLLKDINGNADGWKHLEEYFKGVFPKVISNVFYYNGVRTNGLQINVEPMITENKNQKLKNKTTSRNQQILKRPERILSQTCSQTSLSSKIQICLEKLHEIYNSYNNVELPYFNFVINGESFVHTVYNIFILSFLIREHHAILSADKHHQLWIRPAVSYEIYRSRKDEDNSSINMEEDYSSSQLMVSINTKDWMILKTALGITSSMLPIMCSHSEDFE